MANPKYQFFKRFTDADSYVNNIVSKVSKHYKDKYYSLWMKSKFEWNGLDEEMAEQQENYIMRHFWHEGCLALRNIGKTGMLAMADFSIVTRNYLDFPETVTLVNKRGVSTTIIPTGEQIVNKDVAILYCTPTHKSIEEIVNYYVDRIVQAELLINNNLMLQNIPFVIGCDETDKEQLDDIVKKILNNEIVVYTSVGDLAKLQTLATKAEYIVDKVKSYEVSLENELLTILGIDNSGVQAKKAQMLVDEVNSNNDVINDYSVAIEDEINSWLERANKVLGRNITITAKSKPVDTTHDYEANNIVESKEDEE